MKSEEDFKKALIGKKVPLLVLNGTDYLRYMGKQIR